MMFVGSTLVTQMGFFGGIILIIVRKVPSNLTIFVKKELKFPVYFLKCYG